MENKRLIAAAKTAVILRNYQRARQRALTKLANAHPGEYKAYLKEEKHNDHTQGKAWIDIYGNTSPSMDTNTGANTSRSETETTQGSNQSRASNL
jgi:hypothetical protein